MEHTLVYAAVSQLRSRLFWVILGSRRGSTNAMSFVAGWAAGVAICAVGFTVVVGGLDATDSHPVWIGVLDAVVGVAFLVLAAKLWLQPRLLGSPPWLDVVDGFTPVRAASLGAFLSGAKVVAHSLGAALSLPRRRQVRW